MNEIQNNSNLAISNNELEISCGNCWGHQEYKEGYVDKSIDRRRDEKDNFISRFVKKYIRNTK